MIREDFADIMRANTGCAIVMAGSDSDDKPKGEKPSHIEQIAISLEEFRVPYEVFIASAHKQAGEVMQLVKQLNGIGGSVTYVAVAGGTDALSGIVSYHALGPVISCPPDAPNESCLRNPPGSSNAYVARPANAGRLVAQIYAGVNPEMRKALIDSRDGKIAKLRAGHEKVNKKYADRQRD